MTQISAVPKTAVGAPAEISGIERSVIRKATIWIIPFVVLAYFFAYLDRVNVGIAALEMNADLKLSSAAFGLGSGIFFVGYFILEVPSNMLLERFGARRWIARIMISWGLLSGLTAFVTGAKTFVVLRFFLGAAEAGLYPGVILYLTYFFPARYRGRMIAFFTLAVPIALFLGSPISSVLLEMHGLGGLRGWQWLFLIEAAPSILLGLLCLAILSDSPAQAPWLTVEEKAWLETELREESSRHASEPRAGMMQVMFDKRVIAAGVVSSAVSAAAIALGIWQPQIIKAYGLTNMQSGVLSAAPYGFAAVAMVVWGRYSDRSGRLILCIVLPLLAVLGGLVALSFAHSLVIAIASLTAVMVGIYAWKGPFWSYVTEAFPPSALAVAVAQINAVGALASFAGTYLIGAIKDATDSFELAMLPLIGLAIAGIVCVPIMNRQPKATGVDR